jgi:[acyl-carrier-protein] S-malonyltransferase
VTKAFAMVFPGQGSQSVGMLSELSEHSAVVGETFAEASDALGFDLWNMVLKGPEADLNLTHNTQPAMLAAGVSVWRAWQQLGGSQPAVMAGHSLGEYTALVCSGGLDFADAVKLVAERGRLMQEAVPEGEGAMAAILGLDDDAVREICVRAAGDEICEAVNFNSPGQVVAAGNKAAVDRVVELAKEAGAKRALPLPVSVPSHCALMKPAAEKLAERLAFTDITMPSIPVIHNVNVSMAAGTDEIKTLLAQQLYSPVRWVETVRRMKNDGIGLLLEAGPGKVLAGLTKRIDREMAGMAVFDVDSLGKAMQEVANAE